MTPEEFDNIIELFNEAGINTTELKEYRDNDKEPEINLNLVRRGLKVGVPLREIADTYHIKEGALARLLEK